jgi:hypothetical protein
MYEGARRRDVVYAELKKIGLTDRQIAVLSLWWENRSVREVAAFCRLSKTQVQRVLDAARKQITSAGLCLPPRPRVRSRVKVFYVDPRVLSHRADQKE